MEDFLLRSSIFCLEHFHIKMIYLNLKYGTSFFLNLIVVKYGNDSSYLFLYQIGGIDFD